MEQINGLDVGWMTHVISKDRTGKPASASTATTDQVAAIITNPPGRSTPRHRSTSNPPPPPPKSVANNSLSPLNATIRTFAPHGSVANDTDKSASADVQDSGGPAVNSPPPRRNSWLSSMALKLTGGSPQPQTDSPNGKPAMSPIPRPSSKQAVLPPATRSEGNGPYTPAPPRLGQSGIFNVLRRLSSHNGSMNAANARGGNGLVERRILNVDPNRKRCPIADEFGKARLSKVAFCVDVEIAPMPRYKDENHESASDATGLPTKKKKTTDKEDQARQSPKHAEGHKETGGLDGHYTGAEGNKSKKGEEAAAVVATTVAADDQTGSPDKTTQVGSAGSGNSKSRKKKKNKEAERKARNEEKRKQAEANGLIPMKIYRESSESSRPSTANSGETMTTTKTAQSPTTNPCRVYRRCCQLRESDILKKIVEQLSNPANVSTETGSVEKLDLTGYSMQLDDLRTLGDWLAVVEVRELLLDGCGITDEGLRCVLAGLLAAKKPGSRSRRRRFPVASRKNSASETKSASSSESQFQFQPPTAPASSPVSSGGGVIERLVLRNNDIGTEGWRHICLFICMCRSIKSLDLSAIAFPQPPPAKSSNRSHSAAAMAQLLSRCLADRLADPASLQLLSLGETMLTSEQLGIVVDGMVQCGLRKLCLANNGLDTEGVRHVARYLAEGNCEALVLSGNDLRDELGTLAAAIERRDRHPDGNPLWGLSLADCNLNPSSLAALLPALTKLRNYRFIDLSHNRDLFGTEPSAVCTLRRYLPRMRPLKRVHLADVSMGYEQAIAIAEVLPDVAELAHVVLLENPELAALAHAGENEAEKQEEACALYASLLTAAKLSRSLMRVDVEVPGEGAAELVKAMAKQVVAYCLRNMERLSVTGGLGGEGEEGEGGGGQDQGQESKADEHEYNAATVLLDAENMRLPNVMNHILDCSEEGEDQEPDEHYVIGGSGVVKALACCLRNKTDDLTSRSEENIVTKATDDDYARGAAKEGLKEDRVEGEGEFNGPKSAKSAKPALGTSFPVRLAGSGVSETSTPSTIPVTTGFTPGKAKEMSKELLLSARRIRQRLQPAVARVRQDPTRDDYTRRRLDFLDQTLLGIIRRFEDEFPETRIEAEAEAEAKTGLPSRSAASPLPSTTSQDGTVVTGAEGIMHSDDDDGGISGPDMMGSGSQSKERDASSIGDSVGDGGGDDYAGEDYEHRGAGDDKTQIANIRPLSRTNSAMSQTSRAHAKEEAHVLRAGHRFRAGIGLGVMTDAGAVSDDESTTTDPSLNQDYGHGGGGDASLARQSNPHHAAQWQDLLSRGLDEASANPVFVGVLEEMLEDLGGEVRERMRAEGAVQLFKQDRELISRALREADPENWRLFSESQEKARANARNNGRTITRTNATGGAPGETA